MNRETMLKIRNLLYTITALGFAFMLLGLFVYKAFPGFMGFYCETLFNIDPLNAALVILLLFGFFKIIIVTLFFIPALAIHWQYRKN